MTFTSTDSTNCRWQTVSIYSWECENTVFDLWFVKFVDTKPVNRVGLLYLLKKKSVLVDPCSSKACCSRVNCFFSTSFSKTSVGLKGINYVWCYYPFFSLSLQGVFFPAKKKINCFHLIQNIEENFRVVTRILVVSPWSFRERLRQKPDIRGMQRGPSKGTGTQRLLVVFKGEPLEEILT